MRPTFFQSQAPSYQWVARSWVMSAKKGEIYLETTPQAMRPPALPAGSVL
jgi:hypothetical protein